MKKNKILTIFAAICAISTFAGCSKNQNRSKISFILDWTPNTNHTGLFVAQEKGFFAEEGLEVEIIQPSEDSATMMVASGRAQFGVGFQDSLAPAILRGNRNSFIAENCRGKRILQFSAMKEFLLPRLQLYFNTILLESFR